MITIRGFAIPQSSAMMCHIVAMTLLHSLEKGTVQLYAASNQLSHWLARAYAAFERICVLSFFRLEQNSYGRSANFFVFQYAILQYLFHAHLYICVSMAQQ